MAKAKETMTLANQFTEMVQAGSKFDEFEQKILEAGEDTEKLSIIRDQLTAFVEKVKEQAETAREANKALFEEDAKPRGNDRRTKRTILRAEELLTDGEDGFLALLKELEEKLPEEEKPAEKSEEAEEDTDAAMDLLEEYVADIEDKNTQKALLLLMSELRDLKSEAKSSPAKKKKKVKKEEGLGFWEKRAQNKEARALRKLEGNMEKKFIEVLEERLGISSKELKKLLEMADPAEELRYESDKIKRKAVVMPILLIAQEEGIISIADVETISEEHKAYAADIRMEAKEQSEKENKRKDQGIDVLKIWLRLNSDMLKAMPEVSKEAPKKEKPVEEKDKESVEEDKDTEDKEIVTEEEDTTKAKAISEIQPPKK